MCRRGQKSTPGLLLAAGMLAGLMGCEDSVRHPVQVHPIQIAPPAVREFSPPPDPLPLATIRGKTTPLVVLFSRGSWRAVVDPAEARIPAPREGLSEWDGLVRGGGPNPHTPSIRRAYRQQATALASIFGPGDTW